MPVRCASKPCLCHAAGGSSTAATCHQPCTSAAAMQLPGVAGHGSTTWGAASNMPSQPLSYPLYPLLQSAAQPTAHLLHQHLRQVGHGLWRCTAPGQLLGHGHCTHLLQHLQHRPCAQQLRGHLQQEGPRRAESEASAGWAPCACGGGSRQWAGMLAGQPCHAASQQHWHAHCACQCACLSGMNEAPQHSMGLIPAVCLNGCALGDPAC
jgi:hypothetical protein